MLLRVMITVCLDGVASAQTQTDVGTVDLETEWNRITAKLQAFDDDITYKGQLEKAVAMSAAINAYHVDLIEGYFSGQVKPATAAKRMDSAHFLLSQRLARAGAPELSMGVAQVGRTFSEGTSIESNRVHNQVALFAHSDAFRAISIAEEYLIKAGLFDGSQRKQEFDTSLCFTLARLYEKTENPQEAAYYYEALLEWAVNNPYANKAHLDTAWLFYEELASKHPTVFTASQRASIKQEIESLPDWQPRPKLDVEYDQQVDDGIYAENWIQVYGEPTAGR